MPASTSPANDVTKAGTATGTQRGRTGRSHQRDAPGPSRALDDNTIREVALHLLADEGPDALSLPRIAIVGGFTSGPLYRRYDTGADVAADLWSCTLRDHLRAVVHAAVPWSMAHNGAADSEWLTEDVLRPSVKSRALLGLLSVARRLGPQGEDIRADVEAILLECITRETSLPGVMTLAHLTPVFGAWMLEPITSLVSDTVVGQRQLFSAEYRDPTHWSAASADIPYSPPAPPSWDSGDVTLDELRAATLRVVSRYGCAGATSNRITREAGRSITSAYRRLGNKEQLVADAIGVALSSEFGFSGSETASSMPFSRADRMQRALYVLRNQIHPSNRANRAFLLESLLAARYDTLINRTVRRWADGVDQRFRHGAAVLGLSNEHTVDSVVARWEFRIVSGVGALLLSMVAQPVIDRFDPMPVTSASDAVGMGFLTR